MCWTADQHSDARGLVVLNSISALLSGYFSFFQFGWKLHLNFLFFLKNMSQTEMLPWFIWKHPNKFPQVCSCSLVYAICTLAEFCWCVRLWNKAARIKKIIENSIGPAVLWDLLNVKNSPQIHKLLVTIHSVLLILVNIVLVRKGLASHFTISGCFPADQ